MSIDGCPHSFAVLASEILPGHMEQLRIAMASPLKASAINEMGVGERTILKRLGRQDDFPGVYAFLREGKGIYVGITDHVVERLVEHIKGTTHNSASCAFMIAKKRTGREGERDELMGDKAFRRAFRDAQEYLTTLDVAFVEIADPVTRYVFEVYAAMAFDCEWNSFDTH